MKSKLGAAATAIVTVIETLPIEEVDKDTIKDYETLNDRCDQVITKIRDRKSKKDDKKNTK